MKNTFKNIKSSRAAKALSLFLTSVLVFSPSGLIAGNLPTGHKVVSGAVTVSTNGNTMNISQASTKAIVNWQSFSIGNQNVVNVIQPDSLGKAAMLARVVGNDPSDILGKLNADQTFYLVNPNGVFFGANSRVDVGAMFAASTLNISDADFMAGKDIFSGDSKEGVINLGVINAQAAALIGNAVVNAGTVNAASQAALLGTREVELTNFGKDAKLTVKFGDEKASTAVVNSGDIFAGGDAILFSDGGWTDNSQGRVTAKDAEISGKYVDLLKLGEVNAETLLIDPVGTLTIGAGSTVTPNYVTDVTAYNGVDDYSLTIANGTFTLKDGANDYNAYQTTLAVEAGYNASYTTATYSNDATGRAALAETSAAAADTAYSITVGDFDAFLAAYVGTDVTVEYSNIVLADGLAINGSSKNSLTLSATADGGSITLDGAVTVSDLGKLALQSNNGTLGGTGSITVNNGDISVAGLAGVTDNVSLTAKNISVSGAGTGLVISADKELSLQADSVTLKNFNTAEKVNVTADKITTSKLTDADKNTLLNINAIGGLSDKTSFIAADTLTFASNGDVFGTFDVGTATVTMAGGANPVGDLTAKFTTTGLLDITTDRNVYLGTDSTLGKSGIAELKVTQSASAMELRVDNSGKDLALKETTSAAGKDFSVVDIIVRDKKLTVDDSIFKADNVTLEAGDGVEIGTTTASAITANNALKVIDDSATGITLKDATLYGKKTAALTTGGAITISNDSTLTADESATLTFNGAFDASKLAITTPLLNVVDKGTATAAITINNAGNTVSALAFTAADAEDTLTIVNDGDITVNVNNNVDSLNATSTNGTLTLGGNVVATNTTATAITLSGKTGVTAQDLTSGYGISVASAEGNVSTGALSAAADSISVSTTTSGDVTVGSAAAADAVTLNSKGALTAGALTATAGEIDLDAVNNINANGALTAGTNVKVDTTSGAATLGGKVKAGNGTVGFVEVNAASIAVKADVEGNVGNGSDNAVELKAANGAITQDAGTKIEAIDGDANPATKTNVLVQATNGAATMNGTIVSANDATVEGKSVEVAGAVTAATGVTINATAGDAAVKAAVSNTGEGNVSVTAAQGAFSNTATGTIAAADGTVTLSAKSADVSGAVNASKGISVTATAGAAAVNANLTNSTSGDVAITATGADATINAVVKNAGNVIVTAANAGTDVFAVNGIGSIDAQSVTLLANGDIAATLSYAGDGAITIGNATYKPNAVALKDNTTGALALGIGTDDKSIKGAFSITDSTALALSSALTAASIAIGAATSYTQGDYAVKATTGDVAINTGAYSQAGAIIADKGNVTISATTSYSQAGAITASEGNVKITAAEGTNYKAIADNGAITATKGNITIDAASFATDNANLAGGDLAITAHDGNLALGGNTTVSGKYALSSTGTLTIGSAMVSINDGSTISAAGNISINTGDANFALKAAEITSTSGDVTIGTGATKIKSLAGTTITADGANAAVAVDAKEISNAVIDPATITIKADSVSDTTLTATTSIKIDPLTAAKVDVTGTAVSAPAVNIGTAANTAGKVSLTSTSADATAITVNALATSTEPISIAQTGTGALTANVTGAKLTNVSLSTSNSALTATVVAADAALTLDSSNAATLNAGSDVKSVAVTAGGDVEVNDNNDVIVNGISTAGDVAILVPGVATISGDVKGKNIDINGGTIDATTGEIAPTGTLTLVASDSISITKLNATSGIDIESAGDINITNVAIGDVAVTKLTTTNGTVSYVQNGTGELTFGDGSTTPTLSATGKITITDNAGSINITSPVQTTGGADIEIIGFKGITTTGDNATIDATNGGASTGAVTLKALGGAVTTAAAITAKTAADAVAINIAAKNDVDLNALNVAAGNINLSSDIGKVESVIAAATSDVVINAGTDATIEANSDMKSLVVNAVAGAVTVNDANAVTINGITAGEGKNVTVTAGTGAIDKVTLAGNVSGATVSITAGDITGVGTVSATNGLTLDAQNGDVKNGTDALTINANKVTAITAQGTINVTNISTDDDVAVTELNATTGTLTYKQEGQGKLTFDNGTTNPALSAAGNISVIDNAGSIEIKSAVQTTGDADIEIIGFKGITTTGANAIIDATYGGASTGAVTLKALGGAITTAGDIKAQNDGGTAIDIAAKNDVDLNGKLTVSFVVGNTGGDVNLRSDTGKVEGLVDAGASKLTINAGTAVTLEGGTKAFDLVINAGSDVTIGATSDFSEINVTATAGAVTVNDNNAVEIKGIAAGEGKNVTVNAAGNVIVSGDVTGAAVAINTPTAGAISGAGTISATNGLTLKAHDDIANGASALTINANKVTEISTANSGSINVTNLSTDDVTVDKLTAAGAGKTITYTQQGAGKLTLGNGTDNITANGSITVNDNAGDVKLKSDITSDTGDIEIKGNSIDTEKAITATAGKVKLEGLGGSVTIADITAKKAGVDAIDIAANGDVTFGTLDVDEGDIKLVSNIGKVEGTLDAAAADVNINAGKAVTLNANSKADDVVINAGEDVTIAAGSDLTSVKATTVAGAVTVNDANAVVINGITAGQGKDVTVTAGTASAADKVTISGDIVGADVSITAGAIDGANKITATNGLTLDAQKGGIDDGALLTIEANKVNKISAADGDVNVHNISTGDVEVTELTAANGAVSYTQDGSGKLKFGDGTASAKLSAKDGITVMDAEGSVELTSQVQTTAAGDIAITGFKGITTGSNATINATAGDTTGAVTLTADGGAVTTAAKITASKDGAKAVEVNAKDAISLAELEAKKGNIAIASTDGNVTASKLTATAGYVRVEGLDIAVNGDVTAAAKIGGTGDDKDAAVALIAKGKVDQTAGTIEATTAGDVMIDAEGAVTLAGTEVKSDNGSIVIDSAEASVTASKLTADNGTVVVKAGSNASTVTDAKITLNGAVSANSVTLQADSDIAVKGISVDNGDIEIYSATAIPAAADFATAGGSVAVNGALQTTGGTGNIIIVAANDIKADAAANKIEATVAVLLKGNGVDYDATIQGSSVEVRANGGKVDLSAGVTATASDITIYSNEDSVTVAALTADSGNVAVEAGKNTATDNGAGVTLNGAVQAQTVELKADGSVKSVAAGTLKATVNDVDITARTGDVELLGTVTADAKDVKVSAAEGKATFAADVKATAGNISVTAGGDVATSKDAAKAKLTAGKNITVTTDGNAKFDEAVTAGDGATTGYVNVNAADITVNANMTGDAADANGDAIALVATGKVSQTAGTIEAKDADVNIKADGAVALAGTEVKAANNVKIASTDGNVAAPKLTATAGYVKVEGLDIAVNGDVTAAAKIGGTGTDKDAAVALIATGKVDQSAGTIKATTAGDVMIDAEGAVTLAGTEVQSENGSVIIDSAAGNVTANALTAKTDVIVTAGSADAVDAASVLLKGNVTADRAVELRADADIEAQGTITGKGEKTGIDVGETNPVDAGVVIVANGNVTLKQDVDTLNGANASSIFIKASVLEAEGKLTAEKAVTVKAENVEIVADVQARTAKAFLDAADTIMVDAKVDGNSVEMKAGKNVKVYGAVTSKTTIDVTASAGGVETKNDSNSHIGTFTAGTDIIVTADGNAKFEGAVTAGDDTAGGAGTTGYINVNAADITVNANMTADAADANGDAVALVATGKVSQTAGTIEAKAADVKIEADGAVALAGTEVKAAKNVKIASTDGNVAASKLTAEAGYVKVEGLDIAVNGDVTAAAKIGGTGDDKDAAVALIAKGKVDQSAGTIKATTEGDVMIDADAAVTLAGTEVQSENGSVIIDSAAGNVTANALTAKTDVIVTAGSADSVDAASVLLKGNVTADRAVELRSDADIEAQGTITGKGEKAGIAFDGDTVTAGIVLEANGNVTLKQAVDTQDGANASSIYIKGVNVETTAAAAKLTAQKALTVRADSIGLKGDVESNTAKVTLDAANAIMVDAKATGVSVELKAGNDIGVFGDVTSKDEIVLTAETGNIVTKNEDHIANLAAGTDITVTAGGNATFDGTVTAGDDTASGAATTGYISVTAADITINADMTADKADTPTDVAVFLKASGKVTQDAGTTIGAEDGDNDADTVESVVINAEGAVKLEGTVIAEGDVDVNGNDSNVTVNDLTANAGFVEVDGNDIAVNGDVTAYGDAILNAKGKVTQDAASTISTISDGDNTTTESVIINAEGEVKLEGTVTANDNIEVNGNDSNVTVNALTANDGYVKIDGLDIALNGDVTANKGDATSGNAVEVNAKGKVTQDVATTISANSDGDDNTTENVYVKAENGAVTLGTVTANTSIEIDSSNSNVTAEALTATDGDITVTAGSADGVDTASVKLNGAVQAGGNVEVTADAKATLSGAVTAGYDAGATDTNKGYVKVAAADIVVDGAVTADQAVGGTGDDAVADVSLTATGAIAVNQAVNANADGIYIDGASLTTAETNGTLTAAQNVEVKTTGDATFNAAVTAGDGDTTGYVKVDAEGKAKVNAQVTADAANAATGDAIAINGAGVEVADVANNVALNATAGDVTVDAKDGEAKIDGKVTAAAGGVEIDGGKVEVNNAISANQALTDPADPNATEAIVINANSGDVTTGANGTLTSADGDIDVKAADKATLNAAVIAGTAANASSKANVEARNDVEVNAAVTAAKNVAIESTEANVSVTNNASISAGNDADPMVQDTVASTTASVKAKNNVTIDGTVTSQKGIEVVADEGNANVNAALTAGTAAGTTAGDIAVSAGKDANIAAIVTANEGGVDVSAANNATVSAAISADKALNAQNEAVKVTTTNGTVEVTNAGSLAANDADIAVDAGNEAKINGAVTANTTNAAAADGQDVSIKAANDVTIDAAVTAKENLNVESTAGSVAVKATNGSLTSTASTNDAAVNVNAKENVALSGAVGAQENVTVKADNGSVNVAADVTSANAGIDIDAGGNVEQAQVAANAKGIQAQGAVTIDSTNGNVTIDQVESTNAANGSVVITASNGSIARTNANANDTTDVKATNVTMTSGSGIGSVTYDASGNADDTGAIAVDGATNVTMTTDGNTADAAVKLSNSNGVTVTANTSGTDSDVFVATNANGSVTSLDLAQVKATDGDVNVVAGSTSVTATDVKALENGASNGAAGNTRSVDITANDLTVTSITADGNVEMTSTSNTGDITIAANGVAAGNDVSADSQRDINVGAGGITAGNDVSANSGRDISLGANGIAAGNDVDVEATGGSITTTATGNTITSGNNITMGAQSHIGDVASNKPVNVTASGSVSLENLPGGNNDSDRVWAYVTGESVDGTINSLNDYGSDVGLVYYNGQTWVGGQNPLNQLDREEGDFIMEMNRIASGYLDNPADYDNLPLFNIDGMLPSSDSNIEGLPEGIELEESDESFIGYVGK